jgi:kinesin family protein 2/24
MALAPKRKQERAAEDQRNKAAGKPGDVDFVALVRKWREAHARDAQPRETTAEQEHPRICICVRKRPVFEKERQKNDHDCVTCLHPDVWVHHSKLRVDGITKYLDHNSFRFDHAFDENVTTEEVYRYSTMPLIEFVANGTGGRATVFAYGQTGSGKTFTMGREGIQEMAAQDLFLFLSSGGPRNLSNTAVSVSMFEIYSGQIQDLLNNRNRLKVLEDGKGEIQVTGLEEYEAKDPSQFLELVSAGNE